MPRNPTLRPEMMGPFPLEPDGKSVTVYGRNAVAVRFSVEDYGLAMSRRFFADKDGYIAFHVPARTPGGIRAKAILMHRVVARAESGEVVDHRRNIRNDLRRGELRRCTRQQNSAARRWLLANKLSKYRGVTRHVGGKWQAALKVGATNHYLGLFATEWQAAVAYNRKAKEVHGQFAHLNAPGVDLRRLRSHAA